MPHRLQATLIREMLKKTINLGHNKLFQGSLIAILILYQMIRLIIFANIYGGIEHDSGWFLGLARSLAETGSYTTMVSTIANPTPGGQYDGRYNIQNEEGRIYFFIEGTVGPTQVIPDAMMIKLFGSGFWQFRAASLIFYLLFLILASWLLLSMGGFWAAFLFQVILFFYPHLSVFLGYESLGEVPMIFFILSSFLTYTKATSSKKQTRTRWFFLSGLCAGLAVMSKLIALLSLNSLGFLWLILFWQKKVTIKEGIITLAGFVALPFVWESVQLITITRLFDLDTYLRHTQQSLDFFISGSGIERQITRDSQLMGYRLFLISEISHPNPALSLISLLTITAGGPFLAWYFRGTQLYQNLIALVWGGWLIHTLWFILLAQSGWVRRYWVALILGALILSLLWGILLRRASKPPILVNLSLAVAMTLLIGINFHSQRQATTLLLSDPIVAYWHQKHLAAPRTQLPWIIVPRSEQEAAAMVLRQLPTSAHVFYPSHKSAEMAVVSGRILYPIERRPFMPRSEQDVLLIGPSLISRWAKLMEKPMSQVERDNLIGSVIERVKQECPHILFENNFYIICQLN